MELDCITYQDSGYYSQLIIDYLQGNQSVRPFYGNQPDLDGFKLQLEQKSSFSKAHRSVLVSSLNEQYRQIATSELVINHIDQLLQNNCFTITTGHQLNLFTGPLYFLYKIISVINSCKSLKHAYPEYDFVPVYWMATEDHDFDEINHFYLNGKIIRWEGQEDQHGAVGEFKTDGLEEVLSVLKAELGPSEASKELCDLFEQAYINHTNLSQATFYLANELFKKEGLVIIDPNKQALKRLFIPQIKKEFSEQVSFHMVSKTIEELSASTASYSIQVNPRELNFFYLNEGLRERIVKEGTLYKVLNTDISYTESELTQMIENHPEYFSPNVILRPLYQEVILPNLAYIGGAGELAYWLELKKMFEGFSVTFPILMLRDSVLIISTKQSNKIDKLGISSRDLFLSREDLINKHIRKISNIDIDLSPLKDQLQTQFKELYRIASQTDASFLGAVKAQEKKQFKGVDQLEKRLLNAQKKKLSDQIARLVQLQEELFPREGLQERASNFSEFYSTYSSDFKKALLDNLDPFKKVFTILKM